MEHKHNYTVEKMCKYLEVSKSAYYAWCANLCKDVQPYRKAILTQKIRDIYEDSNATYGSPRITVELHKKGFTVSRPYVARLMKDASIKYINKKRFINTTNSDHDYKIADNLLNRDFNPSKLGEVWVSDITYVRAGDNWIYLTTMIDLADRQVVGWSLSKDMTYENTVLKAWNAARKRRSITENFMLHSDRGVQYACNKIRGMFSLNKTIKQSMSRKGNCWDNAVAESFFKTIKSELIYRDKYHTFKQAYDAIYNYIENWYNIKRIHSALGYKTPLEMELKLRGYNNMAA